jgi:predicted permease
VRQLLTESLLLAAAGATLGAILAAWGVQGLVLAAPASVPRLAEIGIDARVLLSTLGLTVITGLLFGLAPALHSVRHDLSRALTEGGRAGTAGGHRQLLRRVLVGGQVALALVLVTGAGLLVQSFLRLREVDPGFQPEGLLTARVELSSTRFATGATRREFYRDLVDRLSHLPGVRAAAVARALPMTGRLEIGDWSFILEGRAASPPLPTDYHPADWQVVTPGYFGAMRIPVREGRDFTEADRIGAPGAVIVNRTLARQVWPGEDPVGQRVLLGGGGVDSVWRTVVGVVGDVHHRGLSEAARPEMYLPYAQFPAGTGSPPAAMYVAMRVAGDPEALTAQLRATVATLDADTPVAETQTMEAAMGAWAAERRLIMLLVSGFAAIALLLGAVGIYGVMAHLVGQREREIGIRMALGAVPEQILQLVVSQSALVVGGGIVAGTLGALAVTRLLAGLLFHIQPTDPLTFAGTALALAAVAAGATLLPALRAVRTDPAHALRSD